MTFSSVEQDARESLPPRDRTQPGPQPMSLDEVMDKIATEYGDALEQLGKL